MDSLVFNETMVHLTKALRKAIDEEDKTDTLSLRSLAKSGLYDKEKPEDEQEFLKHQDEDYSKAKEAEAEQS